MNDENKSHDEQLPGMGDSSQEFDVCPDCAGKSNTDPDVNCGTCGCAGIIPKPKVTYDVMFDCAWCPDYKGIQKVRDVLDGNGQDVGVCICEACDKKNHEKKEKDMKIDPIKLCCGKKQSEHVDATCPDGLTMCCLCFNRFPPDQLYVDEEDTRWDVCLPCKEKENQAMNTNTSKEDTMKKDTKCVGLTKENQPHNSPAKQVVEVRQLNGKAYLPEKFPHTDKGWLLADIPVCGNCMKMLNGNPGCLKIKYLSSLDKDPIPTEDHYNGDTKEEEEMKDMTVDQLKKLLEDNIERGVELRNEADAYEPGEAEEMIDNLQVELKTLEDLITKKEEELTHVEAVQALEGQDYHQVRGKNGGNLLVEKCTHEDCWGDHAGNVRDFHSSPKGKSWTVLLCLHHVPFQEKFPGATEPMNCQFPKKEWQVKEWMETEDVKVHCAKLHEEGFSDIVVYHAANGHGRWVYWTAFPELKPATHVPAATPVVQKITKVGHTPKCGACKGTHKVYPQDYIACGNAAREAK